VFLLCFLEHKMDHKTIPVSSSAKVMRINLLDQH
jgi:hypothetical protein